MDFYQVRFLDLPQLCGLRMLWFFTMKCEASKACKERRSLMTSETWPNLL